MSASLRAMVCALVLGACATSAEAPPALQIEGAPEVFALGVASTEFSEVRLTISPDGRTALWFSRNRPGGPGGYDIWMSRRVGNAWSAAELVPFNSPTRDFDPAFSADGRYVYFASDRAGALGGDDLWRVDVTADGFGELLHLAAGVNSEANEWAPMVSPDGARLLFSSNRPDGAGRMDVYVARRDGGEEFVIAARLEGGVNTAADEFDATFLADSSSIVFSRAPDLMADRIDLVFSAEQRGRYGVGQVLPPGVNDAQGDTYGPMLDWSAPGRLTYSGRRAGGGDMDLYRVRYRLDRPAR
jgi:TolB protein